MFGILEARNSGWLFSIALILAYVVSPLAYFQYYSNPRFIEVAQLGAVAGLIIFIFFFVSFSEKGFVLPKVEINEKVFLSGVFVCFAVFAVFALLTAREVPLVLALQGAKPEEISIAREEFLKARTGWQASFVYINAVFTGALLPYCLARLFVGGYSLRWPVFFMFFLFSISFMEKAFFLKSVIPVFYLLATNPRSKRYGFLAFAGVSCILILMAIISGSGSGEVDTEGIFFANNYVPSGALDHLIWRIFSVPVFTAADSLAFFDEVRISEPFLGGTSSLLSWLFSERVLFERAVFEFQWGQTPTGTGSANSVFFIEAFVNYGIWGVMLFSVAVGSVFKLFSKTRDLSLKAIWPLFAIGVFSAGLIGTFASNGFLLVFLISMLVDFKRVQHVDAK